MKITLISFDQELFCIGIRTLSAFLKQNGHRVQCIFLPPQTTQNLKTPKFQVTYSKKLLSAIKDLCLESNLIGMSLMTNQLLAAINVTKYLKTQQIDAPIVWGGIQPTVEPEVCLEYADIVCIGEGEDALLELADHIDHGRSYLETKNLWIHSRGTIVRNVVRPLKQNLDVIPPPDYSCEDHVFSNENSIEDLTKDKFIRFKGERFQSNGTSIPYMIMTSRGCPFSCTYCCNSVYKNLYPHQKHLRFRGTESVMNELKVIQRDLAPISLVYIVDDNFTSRPNRDLSKFLKRYKAEIGLPFYCQISPLTINKSKMTALFESGCTKVTMGVETASKRIAEIYNRRHFHRALPDSISLMEEYRSKMFPAPTYQFIIDNPYETLDETLETLKLAVSLPRPWNNPIYSLMLFPGTPLYERAKRDGLILDNYSQIYARNWLDQSKPFFQLWIRLYRANISPFLLKILLQSWIARFLTTNFVSTTLKMKIFRWLWANPR